ncbi:GvpL/GvpF family gas vesicle protein [Pseudonocardia aurantiaca]
MSDVVSETQTPPDGDAELVTPVYVYGLIRVDTQLPDDLAGLGPSGRVSTIEHGEVAAIVSDIPLDRPLGTRKDLLAHESVVDAVAASAAVLPMRFPAVTAEESVVEELLAPHQDHFLAVLGDLEGRVQFTLKGRYVEDAVLSEVLEGNDEIRALQEKVRDLPEDASYYDRVRLGELVVGVLEQQREDDAAQILERLEPFAVAVVANQPGQPEDVINAAFLVERERMQEFDDAVENVGRDLDGRVRLRLLGPLAPYDFVPEE